MIDRREFVRRATLLGGLAFAGGCKGVFRTGASGNCRLRAGILSDTHLTTRASADILRRSFEQLKARGVTSVLVAGDLTDYGTKTSLRYFRETWDAVFAGTDVSLIACTGNHDYDGHGYGDMAADMRANGMSKEDRLVNPDYAALAEPWKTTLGQRTFEPIHVEKAGDFDCIVAEYHLPKGTLLSWMKENGARFKGEKPFFFMRHDPVQGTTRDGPYGDAEAFEALKDHPNAITITGHSHVSFNDELSLWQDKFTSLAVPSLSYTCLPPSYKTHPRVAYENGGGNHYCKSTQAMPEIPYRRDLRGGQGYVLSLYDDEMVIERIDFEEGVEGAPAWRLPLLGRPGAVARTEARRKADTVAPRFPAGAAFTSATCNTDNRQGHWIIAMDCRFPSAVPGPGERVFEYEVRIVPEDGSAPVYKRFLSPAYGKLACYEPAVQRFWFDLADVPKGKPYHLEARAMNAFGKVSEPLRTGVWQTTDE